MSGHESPVNQTDTWLTPRYVLDALGAFDLDPCTPPEMPWPTAKQRYTAVDDGLSSPWFGRVWLNPPYGSGVIHWMRKLAVHGRGTALVFARTETIWFKETVWPSASAIFFFHHRLSFCNAHGVAAKANAGAPSCLIAYGAEDSEILRACNLDGKFIELTPREGVFA